MPDDEPQSAKRTGRMVGLLLLLQLAAGLTTPFILLQPDVIGRSAFLAAAADHSLRIRSAVLIAFVGAGLTVALAVTLLPVLRRHSSRAAFALLAACTISCALDMVHNASVMSMLSLSQRFVQAGASDMALYQALAGVVATTRRWAHYTQLAAIGAWIFVFYASLWRFRLVPRLLASLGLVGVLLQFTGVTLFTFLGYTQEVRMAMPLGPIQLAVAVWLMVKGFQAALPPDPLPVA